MPHCTNLRLIQISNEIMTEFVYLIYMHSFCSLNNEHRIHFWLGAHCCTLHQATHTHHTHTQTMAFRWSRTNSLRNYTRWIWFHSSALSNNNNINSEQKKNSAWFAQSVQYGCYSRAIHIFYSFAFFFVWLWVTWFIAAYMRRDYRVPKTCWLRLTGAVWSVHCMLSTNWYAWKEKKRRTESISLYYIVVIVVCAAGVKASTSATVPYSLQLCSL